MFRWLPYSLIFSILFAASCQSLQLDRTQPYAFVVFDPAASELPMPNDALFDEDTNQLNLPTDDEDLTAIDVELREALNQQDGWSSVSALTAEFSEPIAPETLNEATLQIWEWGATPQQVTSVSVEIDETQQSLTILAPADGWKRGAIYYAWIRGGENGVKTQNQQDIGPDAAFYYLQHDSPINEYEYQRAFPGDSRADRLESADRLETMRLQLTPMFDFLEESAGVPRADVAAMWRFSTTTSIELAMDPDSQRVPIPFDLLIDPDTGLVDLPPSDTDRELEADAKLQANKLDGFSVSADILFDLTGPVDPNTVNTDTIQLWDISQTPEPVTIRVRAMAASGEAPCWEAEVADDCRHIVVSLDGDALPLKTASTYALTVSQQLKGAEGEPIVPMSIGHMMMAKNPLAQDDTSLVTGLDNESATLMEGVRTKLVHFLDGQDRASLVTAWPFTTLDPIPHIQRVSHEAETRGLSLQPTVNSRLPAYRLFGDDAISDLFPGALNPAPEIYWPRTRGIAEVVEGTLPHPNFLHPETRRWMESPEISEINYMAIIPEDVTPPYPVVIFGHAIVTDRRFVMLVGGELAKRGFASVAIDFPYHGERIACIDASLVAIPNFFPDALRSLLGFDEDLIWLPPCESGDDATCSPTGECLDPQGDVEDFNTFPIIDLKPASGAAFMDIGDIPHIPDHFSQAFVDLGALKHSLKTEDWETVFDAEIRTDKFWYAGQSMGSIIGFPWVATQDDIQRAVFNVPGSNLVNLFRDSTFFSPQVETALEDLEIEPDSYDQVRLFGVASWLMDAIDPHTLGRHMRDKEQKALIQIDKVNENIGDIIIPNYTTENLARVSEIPLLSYPSALHADLIIPGVGEPMLEDMADFLNDELNP